MGQSTAQCMYRSTLHLNFEVVISSVECKWQVSESTLQADEQSAYNVAAMIIANWISQW